MKSNNLSWLRDEYTCKPCKESIAQSFRSSGIEQANPVWIEIVLEFTEKHKNHGFEL